MKEIMTILKTITPILTWPTTATFKLRLCTVKGLSAAPAGKIALFRVLVRVFTRPRSFCAFGICTYYKACGALLQLLQPKMPSILATAICVPLLRITQYSSRDRTSFQFLRWCHPLRLRNHAMAPKCAQGGA